MLKLGRRQADAGRQARRIRRQHGGRRRREVEMTFAAYCINGVRT